MSPVHAALSPPSSAWSSALGSDLALSLGGTALFGAAAAAGHGPVALLHGAVKSPLLFVGGAAFAMPLLYLLPALAGSRRPLAAPLHHVVRALARVSTVLAGLAVPAAWLGITVPTSLGDLLLATVVVLAGTGGVLTVLFESLHAERHSHPRFAVALWGVLALGLGWRLLTVLSLGGAR